MADKKASGYDLEGARKAQISDEDSLQHLAKIHNYDLSGAREAGISDQESLSHLATLPAPAAEVYEKESPEFFGGLTGAAGAVTAAGDVLFSKGRPLFRAAEKMVGIPQDPNLAPAKQRKFLDPAQVTERAIAAREAQMAPTATEAYMKSGQYISPEGKPLYYGAGETGEYSGARKAAERAIETEKMFPGMKVLPGETPIALPKDVTAQVETERAEAQRLKDIEQQKEINQLGAKRARLLDERNRLARLKGGLGGAETFGSKVAAPILGGYELGSQGAQAYNRLTREDLQPSDIAAGATNIAGAGVGASSMLPGRLRLPKAVISTGLGRVADVIDVRNPRKEKSVLEEKAKGGLVYLAEGGGKLGKAVSAAKKLKKGLNFDRFKMSEVYPDVIPPVMATDPKTGKQFLQKQLSPEAVEVQKARKLAQKEIDAGNYEPFFDIEKRFYADPSRYQLAGTTLTDIVPKKADTITKYEQLANQPESLLRLRNAFNVAKDRPLAKDWYAMGQLEDAFIRELGPIEGPKQFRARFADAMAATTGGADPNSNLMMAAFTNYQKGLGKEIPTTAADLPFPIGGRFVSGNMEQAKKLQDIGLIPVTNPKRHNFSANFLGYRDRSTLDEQMSQLWDPKMMAPPPNAYGIYEQALAKEAKRAGVEPANFQDIAWAGAKDYPGKPMIREINEMLARTNMITGEPQEQILKGYIRGNKPMYGIAGAGAGISMDEDEEEKKKKAVGGLIQGYAKGKRVIRAAKDLILPPAENAARTQRINTIPTYKKAGELFDQYGATGQSLDFSAGLGEGAKFLGPNTLTYEPFAQGWKPTFSRASEIPSEAFGKVANLNSLNVVPRETRDEMVLDIGRVMDRGGHGIITARGPEVMTARGIPGPEPTSIITSRDTYQKGFTKQELEDYLRYMLGEKFDIEKLNLGPAGAMIKKKAEGGLAHLKKGGSTTPAWQRAEGKNPEGGLNAKGRASYNRETGGNLKAPQPEGGSRKKSFCARMGGMKKKLTSSKTANDPDSRINKALRKWKC